MTVCRPPLSGVKLWKSLKIYLQDTRMCHICMFAIYLSYHSTYSSWNPGKLDFDESCQDLEQYSITCEKFKNYFLLQSFLQRYFLSQKYKQMSTRYRSLRQGIHFALFLCLPPVLFSPTMTNLVYYVINTVWCILWKRSWVKLIRTFLETLCWVHCCSKN